MPSGPKKRKAAKKKKEKEAHNSNSNSASSNSKTPQGNEDPKSHDERESEGSEVASPVLQDHNRQHPFAEESEKRASGDAERSNTGQGDGEVEKEPKTVQAAKRNGIKHVDSMKERHHGNEKSSSSSSSDDESQAFAKREEKTHDSVSNAISHRDEEKNVDAISEGVPHISGNGKPLKEANNNSDVEPSLAINSDMPVVPMSEVLRPVVEIIQVKHSKFVDESTSRDNTDKILPASTETSGVPFGLLSEKSEDRLTLDEKLTFVEVTSAADTSNDIQNAKESETHECHESRPLVNSTPQPAERTTWMSCCGLFEAFMGSSR